MTKRVFSNGFTVAIFLASICLAGAEVNILPNGSFERRSFSGVPDRWAEAYSSGAAIVVTGLDTRCGDRVLRLVDTSTSHSAGLLSDPLMVNPGASYTTEAYAMRTDTSRNTASLYLKFYNADGAQVGSHSVSGTAAAGVWGYVSVTGTAPASAVTGRVLCYSPINASGTVFFDGVSLRLTPMGSPAGGITRYVSPSGWGNGTGADPVNPAIFNSTVFWNLVKSTLATNAVRVVFLDGEYVMDPSSSRLLLQNIGNASNRLTLEGQYPFGSVFTRTDAAPDATAESGAFTMVHLQRATNVVLRHLHWENDTTLPGKLVSYSLAINSAATGAATKDITVEGCSFVGLSWNIYGAMGFHHKMTRGGTVRHCEFITGGYSGGFHMIYNAYGAYDLLFENNYFQDCAGSYLRLRGGCHEAIVRSNEFVSTSSAYNQPFIQLATFNNIEPGDETWGANFQFTDNRFNYAVASGNVAIHLYHSGFDPYRSPGLLWDYLLTPAEAAILISGSVAAKKELIRQNFGIDFDTQMVIAGNIRQGFHVYEMKLESRSVSSYNYQDSNGVWHICPNYGGDGAYNISDILNAQMAATPTNIIFAVGTSGLTLSWPGSHLGWIAQSNSMAVTAPNSWYDIAGSESATNLFINVAPGMGNVFFRLRRP